MFGIYLELYDKKREEWATHSEQIIPQNLLCNGILSKSRTFREMTGAI